MKIADLRLYQKGLVAQVQDWVLCQIAQDQSTFLAVAEEYQSLLITSDKKMGKGHQELPLMPSFLSQAKRPELQANLAPRFQLNQTQDFNNL